MIRVEKLVKTYGKVRALDGLDLQVDEGAVYGFLGPNGAGKTTTLRILSGLARASSGKATIAGKPAGSDKRLAGVLPEEPAFYPWMTPREYLRDFTAPLIGLDASDASRRAGEALEEAGLSEAADRRIGGFSRGMRQRLGLAQAMLGRPRLLLLDEPVSALDPAGRKEVLDQIERLSGQTTILLSSHILADVERVCDRIGIIDHGRMIVQAERQELLERFAQPVIECECEDGFNGWLEQASLLDVVKQVQLDNHTARLWVSDIAVARQALLTSLASSPVRLRRFEVVRPTLEDVFLRLTKTAEQ